jgi:hypothetical protein
MEDIVEISWLIKTGQAWKLWSLLPLSVIGLLIFLAYVWYLNEPAAPIFKWIGVKEDYYLLFCFVFYEFAVLLWLLLSIRCSNCKRAPVLHIVKTSDASDWISTLRSLSQCPLCGDDSHQSRRLG